MGWSFIVNVAMLILILLLNYCLLLQAKKWRYDNFIQEVLLNKDIIPTLMTMLIVQGCTNITSPLGEIGTIFLTIGIIAAVALSLVIYQLLNNYIAKDFKINPVGLLLGLTIVAHITSFLWILIDSVGGL